MYKARRKKNTESGKADRKTGGCAIAATCFGDLTPIGNE